MVRSYKRKTQRGAAKEAVEQALKLIREDQCSIRQAAKTVGINFVTLSRACKGKETGYIMNRKVFSDQQEQELTEYVLTCSRMNHGLTTVDLRKLAFNFAKANNITYPGAWNTHQSAGRDWLQSYMKRQKNLSIRKPEATSLGRATSFNRHTVQEFFSNLKLVMEKHQFHPSNIYNMDETALTTVHVPPKVIAGKNVKQVSQVTSAERGVLVTCICCVSASGNSIPPAYVWPRKTDRNMSGYMKGTTSGSLGLFHDSGWMTEQNFDLWMEHFITHTKPSKEIPVLLLMDNHQSHLSVKAINLAKESGVVLMTFPPHTTNKLQPLDVSVYGPLKTFYNNSCNNWHLANPGKTIGLYDIGELSAQAITRALNPENILSGYKRTGIQPFDDNIFKDNEFLPSFISDRPDPQPTTVAEPTNESLTSTSEPSTSSVHMQSKSTCSTVTPPSDIRPFPKAGVRKQCTKRRRGKSLVLTNTPVKNQIEKERAERGQSKKKRKKQPVPVYESESEDDEPVPLESDTESPSEESDVELTSEIQEGAYAVVQYVRKNRATFYVARIEKIVEDNITVRFYKKSGEGFVLPENEETDIVGHDDVTRVLPAPSITGGTARSAMKLKFASAIDEVQW